MSGGKSQGVENTVKEVVGVLCLLAKANILSVIPALRLYACKLLFVGARYSPGLVSLMIVLGDY